MAAYAYALSPAAINISTRVIWSTTLLALLCVCLIDRFLMHAAGRTTLRQACATGLLIGACLLTCPTPAFFIALAAMYLLLHHGRAAFANVAVMSLVSLMVISPWLFRNQQAFGSWFFLKSNAGNELFIGNNPSADGSYTRVRRTARQVLSPADFSALDELNELERSRALGQHALLWIREQPTSFLRLTATRFWNYWTAPFITDWKRLPLGPLEPAVPVLYSLGQWTLILAAAIGAWSLRRDRRATILMAFMLAYPAAYYVTHVSISRYRLGVVPIVYLLAAFGLVYVANKLRDPAQAKGASTLAADSMAQR